ncbi:Nse1 non-SMC component of SMC5-6 complex-domain-containing protein [Fimicolochytrium jonesii]|uniref:Nse1 non-SMC component of SMC5-6 complex-domain-containing protein n=1 Tax=Fimicolochytrium jonesii TaxID=1396493 RepID=UPI0022FE632A|nr:Nse1 non-SMC component of SMC5-6 complex-domain-containing protein [Fimicolochytrium jonesii]KAI8818085.1 Nse1 non-SMC component of SMC5-6 complex-domain-containing protein [Fimicolochytrium jonesii]
MAISDTTTRLFIQAYLRHRILPETAVKALHAKVCALSEDQDALEDFPSFIGELNRRVDTFNMELRRGHEASTGKQFYALVNTNGDELAQQATECSPAEIAYFKHLVDVIINADDDVYELSSTAALSEASQMTPAMTKRDAQALIDRLIDNQWLVNRNGLLSLSLRTTLELQTYLKEEYQDRIHECTMCMEMVTSDYERCTVANCKARLHAYCSRVYFTRQKVKKCPTCKSPWHGDALGTGRPRPSGSSTKSGRQATNGIKRDRDALDEEEGEEEEEGDEDAME